MSTPLLVLLCGAAAGRVTRLVVDDKFPFKPMRDWLKDLALTSRSGRWLRDLITCPWCFSGWASAAAFGWLWHDRRLAAPFGVWLAMWWVAIMAYWLGEYLAHYATKDEVEDAVDVAAEWKRIEEGEA